MRIIVAFVVIAVWGNVPSHAQSIEVAGGETMTLGSWAMTLPDANVYACQSASELARYYAALAHNLAFLHNNDSVLPRPTGCTTIDAGSAVQLVQASGDVVCLRQRSQPPSTCLWAKRLAVESKAAFDHDHLEQKSINENVNQVFDRQHPECKEWRTDKHLPNYCY